MRRALAVVGPVRPSQPKRLLRRSRLGTTAVSGRPGPRCPARSRSGCFGAVGSGPRLRPDGAALTARLRPSTWRRSALPATAAFVVWLASPARAGEGLVEFLPAPSGNVGAFLVAGPFGGPQGEIERMAPAREGGTTSADGLAGGPVGRGGSWKLVTTLDGERIVIGGAGAGRGIYYLRTEIPEGPQGRRAVSFAASCDVTVWAGGRTASASAYGRETVEVEAGPGPQVLLARLDVERSRAAFAVKVWTRHPGGGVRPEGGRLALADASEERIAGLVRRSLRLRVSPEMVSERSPVLAEFTRVGSPPAIGGETSVEIAAVRPEFLEPHRGETRRRVSLRELGGERITAGFRVKPGSPGVFTIEARVVRGGVRFVTLRATGFVSEGLAALADSLEERGRSAGREFPGAGALARLQADKIRLSLGRAGGPADTVLLAEDLRITEHALGEAEAGRDFQKDLRGFHERAYVSDIDDSAQPYLVYVPTYYDPGKKWPLVVYLHGYVPSYDKDDWLKGDPQVNAVMEAEGCILAVPFGRSNTDFLNVGEDDVLAVMDEMKKHYSIDPRRIYIYGYSMGGSGVWTMITHFPDVFAAAVVLAGRTDYFLWHKLDRDGLPPWRRFIIETDNPIDYVENIVHVPVRIYHGSADWVIKREHSSRMAEKLKAAGGTCELKWIPRGTHWTMFDTVLWRREPVAWMKEHVLPEKPPEEFTVVARHPRYAAAWEMHADMFREPLGPARVQVVDGGREVRLQNVYQLSFDPKRWPKLDAVKALDGGEYKRSRSHLVSMGLWGPPTDQYTLKAPARRWGGKWIVGGPIKDAFRSPFCIVYGTQGDARARREVKASAERFRKEWRAFAKGWAPIRADTEVTDDLMSRKNLILFGEPETNSVIAAIADSLPIKWDRERATIAGREYPMRRRGLAFVYPNPKQPTRAVVIFSGFPWGDHLPSNHKWDLMPDFILYTPEADMIDTMEKTNDWIVAGFFGTDWSVERGRIFVKKGVGRGAKGWVETDAEGEVVKPEPEPETEAAPPPPPPPTTEHVPEAPPGFSRVR